MRTEWKSFTGGAWEKEINVRDFIQQNYTPYKGDGKFLKEATEDTKDLWQQVLALMKEEREKGGVLDGHQNRLHYHFPWPRIPG